MRYKKLLKRIRGRKAPEPEYDVDPFDSVVKASLNAPEQWESLEYVLRDGLNLVERLFPTSQLVSSAVYYGRRRVEEMDRSKRQKREELSKDRGLLLEFLSRMFPGQDVRLKFRTRDHREFNGIWAWNLIELQHEHVPLKTIKKRLGRDYYDYEHTVVKRVVRWKDILKKHDELREED